MAIDTIASTSIFQEIHQAMPQWFQQGGIVMWLLLLASFLSTVVTLERLYVWAEYHIKQERFVIRDCFAALTQLQKTRASAVCKKLDTPALNMLAHGIKALPFSPNEKMEAYAEEQISLMSRGQSLLDTVITLAPMLGILGTVLGIIDSFNILSLQGVENPTAVVGGIAQALISTAMGLVVALLALLPYNLFRSFIQKLTLHLEITGGEFHHICQQKRLVNNQASKIAQIQEASLTDKDSAYRKDETIAEHSEMPYHYEFKENSDEVQVKLHAEMKNLNKTTQASLLEMYSESLDNSHEYYGVDEVKLQELQETRHHQEDGQQKEKRL
jgi:biopolymer transport protein ExbB/TolQ